MRLRDGSGGCPLIGQAVSGMEAARTWSAASAWNMGRPATILPLSRRAVTGSAPGSRNCEALSTVAALAGGPARSSGEAPVMGVERRGRLMWGLFAQATGRGIFWEET